MSYRRNKQFLLASQRYYKSGHGRKSCDPCDCSYSFHKPEKCDPSHCADDCNTDKCSDPCAPSKKESCECDVCKNNNKPKTITDVLCSLINEQVDVTVPFGVVTGTLLDVKRDYIVVLDDNGDQILVRTGKIESVSPVT